VNEVNKKEAKKRIMEAAVSLFAARGYDAVGVRQIASEAGVNIAMISYYFNGKLGILKAIMEDFHTHYHAIIADVLKNDEPPEDSVRKIIRGLIRYVKENTAITMVAFNTIPIEIPEIADQKAAQVGQLIQAISGLMKRAHLDPEDKVLLSVIGPALLSMILAHFRFKPVQSKAFQIDFDDAFYDKYADTIETLFLYGIMGVAEKSQNKKEKQT
jgi:AcrR family transcriptional regulator